MSLDVDLVVEVGLFNVTAAFSVGATPLAIVGENGAGKTTLLRALVGGVAPRAGRVVLADHLLFDRGSGVDLPPEQRRIGYVPQGTALFPHMSVADNVGFGLRAHAGLDAGARAQKVAATLDQLGCADLQHQRPADLSGGERQRVALARAVITKPAALVLDEPLAALDASARRELRGFLAQVLGEWGVPTVVVTHDPRDVVALGADVLVLAEGRVVQQGTVDGCRANPANAFVSELFSPLEPESRRV